jgi:hypothetical protein
VKKVVNLLESGQAKTITEAATIVGVSREFISRSLGKVHVTDWLHARAKKKLSMAVVRAATVKVALLDSASDHVRNDASSEILQLADIRPTPNSSPLVNVNVSPGYIINLSGPDGNGPIITPDLSE